MSHVLTQSISRVACLQYGDNARHFYKVSRDIFLNIYNLYKSGMDVYKLRPIIILYKRTFGKYL